MIHLKIDAVPTRSIDLQHLQRHGSDPALRKALNCASSYFLSTVERVLQRPINSDMKHSRSINDEMGTHLSCFNSKNFLDNISGREVKGHPR